MKRLVVLCAAAAMAIASAGTAFAVDSSINYAMGGQTYSMTSDDWEGKAKWGWGFEPFGLMVNNTWYSKNSEGNAFRVGFDLAVGMDISFAPRLEGNKMDGWFTLGEYLSLGPGFFVRLTDNDNIHVSPGVQFSTNKSWCFDEPAYYTYEMLDLYVAISLNTAYRHWFTDAVGLNLGFDMDIPVIGMWSYTSKYTYGTTTNTYSSLGTIAGGFDYHFYAGVVLRK